MYAIEIFCGKKYGGWRRTSDRFVSAEGAQLVAAGYHRSEAEAGVTPFARRVRPIVH